MTVRKLQQKLQDGSPQRQGVLSQDDIRRTLQAECAPDEFVVTPPGRRGADILQTVREAGRTYGKILWEVKETSDCQTVSRRRPARTVSGSAPTMSASSLPASPSRPTGWSCGRVSSSLPHSSRASSRACCATRWSNWARRG